MSTRPSLAKLSRGQQALIDLAGDGTVDLVELQGEPAGFFERSDEEGWKHFIPFTSRPNVDWATGNVQLVDLTGDGRADLLITDDGVFTWHESLGEAGFGEARRIAQPLDEESGPHLVLADGTQTVFLADMSGDGLADIVRIRNGEMCYWPNLGYGRFGARITMSGAPWFDAPERFDPRRIRLGDVDGSGVVDIVYVGDGEIRLWFNESGNGWSAAHRLPDFPHVDDYTSVQLADLLGNGTACLVWSSPLPRDAGRALQYIDLMGGTKPHLLQRVVNNCGAESRVCYAASTAFYVADRAAGRPWITRLPFPVHVVERVEHVDHVSRTRFACRYSYHHGYFDGDEREFRGFAMVEQHDVEAFEAYVAGVVHLDGTQELAPELWQPPVTTRTWFHTGAYLEGTRILHQLRGEYYQQQQHVPEPVLPEGMSDTEYREAVRAMRGLPLRQEVYSFDGSPNEQHPYSVAESTYEVRRIQPRVGDTFGVFFAVSEGVDRAQLRAESSRSARGAEPGARRRVLMGTSSQPRRSRTAGRPSDGTLPPEVQAAQGHLHITHAESAFTNDIDRSTPVPAYRLRAACEARSFEITGFSPAASFFTRGELQSAIAAATPIDYEVIADDTSLQKRLLSHDRTIFRSDAFAALPFGELDSLGLVYESYRLAFTPGVTAAHYAGHVTDSEFVAAGYVHLGGDANWWIPSGVALYPVDPASHFYMPRGMRDALGLESIAVLDQYDLLAERTVVVGAPWTETRVVNDYRVLGPVLITDPNQNRTAVEIDALGLVVKSAVMGKEGAGEGDTLADPTTRFEYDLFQWMTHGQPNVAHVFARERHGDPNTRWQESYVYSNGDGTIAMVKARTKPGLCPSGDGRRNRRGGRCRSTLDRERPRGAQQQGKSGQALRAVLQHDLRIRGRRGRTRDRRHANSLLRRRRSKHPHGARQRHHRACRVRRLDAARVRRERYGQRERLVPGARQPGPGDGSRALGGRRKTRRLAGRQARGDAELHLLRQSRTSDLHRFGLWERSHGRDRSELDLTGRYSRVFDQHEREVARGFTGMAGTPILASSAEKGSRWSFLNALGTMVKSWNEQGRSFRIEYDELHRVTSSYATESAGPEILFTYVVYGDRHPQAVARNLLGIAHQVFEPAGMVRIPALDFKGNPTSVERVLARDYTQIPDWGALPAQSDYDAIQTAAAPSLETAEPFVATSAYDALSRPTQVTLHGGTLITSEYDEGGMLASLQALIDGIGEPVDFLKRQDYDAKGQRQFAHYGNDLVTRYFYDPKTYRLTDLVTTPLGGDPVTKSVQRLHYTYDPVGNVTCLRDDAQQTYFFQNAVVQALSRFEYDALYHLTKATGREHARATNDSIRDDRDIDFAPEIPDVNDAGAVRTYTEQYEYDLLGNILSLRHQTLTAAGNWTRRYRYAYQDDPNDATNRLSATSRPGDPDAGPYTATYDYDVYGNMTRLRTPNPGELAWNVLEQLERVDLGGGGTAFYVYGTGGHRVRKVIEHVGSLRTERIYLGALEIYRERMGNDAPHLERHTLHIADGAGASRRWISRRVTTMARIPRIRSASRSSGTNTEISSARRRSRPTSRV